MKPPCMVIVQNVLPALRVEITRQLIEKYGMKKTEAAKRMGITQAAVSQYLSQTRGGDLKDVLKKSSSVMKLIDELTEDIAAGESPLDLLIMRMCRACAVIRSEGLICEIHKEAVPGLREVKGCSCSMGIMSVSSKNNL